MLSGLHVLQLIVVVEFISHLLFLLYLFFELSLKKYREQTQKNVNRLHLIAFSLFIIRKYTNGGEKSTQTDTIEKLASAGAIGHWGVLYVWLGWLAILYAVCMLLDYATGTTLAHQGESRNSSKARQGLWHKGDSTVMLCVSVLTDIFLGLELPFEYDVLPPPIVLTWYISTELGRILENAARMGMSVPPVLRDVLDKVHKTSNKKYSNATEENQDE